MYPLGDHHRVCRPSLLGVDGCVRTESGRPCRARTPRRPFSRKEVNRKAAGEALAASSRPLFGLGSSWELQEQRKNRHIRPRRASSSLPRSPGRVHCAPACTPQMGARGDGAADGVRGPKFAAWAALRWVLPVPGRGGPGWERSPRVLTGSSRPLSVFRLAVCGHKHRLCLKVAPG